MSILRARLARVKPEDTGPLDAMDAASAVGVAPAVVLGWHQLGRVPAEIIEGRPRFRAPEVYDAIVAHFRRKRQGCTMRETERQDDRLGIEPLVSMADLMALLRCRRSTVERMRASGEIPPPDRHVGRMPRWRQSTIRRWIDGDDRKGGRR